ncbi:MAG: hypothetical protein Q7S86_04440 [bacterium]|nr:hypothetical protein [bacterium]
MKQITTPATIERVRALKRKLTEILKDLPEISPGICRFGEGYGVKLNVNVSGLEDFAKTVEFFRRRPDGAEQSNAAKP